MKRNVEIKARARDLDAVRVRAERLADRGPEQLVQEDTFFECPRGRLKLRVFSENAGELIYYERDDAEGPKECRYMLTATPGPGTLREILSRTVGVRGKVRKRRTVFHVGRTRVHLDEVEALGTFVELEVVLSPEQSRADGLLEAGRLMDELGIAQEDLVARAYIDLLVPPPSGGSYPGHTGE